MWLSSRWCEWGSLRLQVGAACLPFMRGEDEWLFFSFRLSFSPKELLFMVSCRKRESDESYRWENRGDLFSCTEDWVLSLFAYKGYKGIFLLYSGQGQSHVSFSSLTIHILGLRDFLGQKDSDTPCGDVGMTDVPMIWNPSPADSPLSCSAVRLRASTLLHHHGNTASEEALRMYVVRVGACRSVWGVGRWRDDVWWSGRHTLAIRFPSFLLKQRQICSATTPSKDWKSIPKSKNNKNKSTPSKHTFSYLFP